MYASHVRALLSLGAWAILLGAGLQAADEPFVRGDVDRDGVLSLGDVLVLSNAIVQRTEGELPCRDAADFTDDGFVRLGDVALLLEHLIKGTPAPPAPHPEPGEDPTGDELGCGSAQVVEPLRDPESVYTIEVRPVAGGPGHFSVRVAFQNSIPAAGGRLVLALPDGWASAPRVVDRTASLELASLFPENLEDGSTLDDSVLEGSFDAAGRLRIVWLTSISGQGEILPAGPSRRILDVTVCAGEATAGEYRLEPVEADLVSEGGDRWLVSAEGASAMIGERTDICEAPFPTRRDVRAYVWVTDAEARIGETFRVSFFGAATPRYETAAFYVRWDPAEFKAVGAEEASPSGHIHGNVENSNSEPNTNDDVRWHTLIPSANPDYSRGVRICDPCFYKPPWGNTRLYLRTYTRGVEPRSFFPPDREVHHFDLMFEVLPTATPGVGWIDLFEEFRVGGNSPGAADNSVRLCESTGNELCHIDFQARPLLDGRIRILPARTDAPPFLRGDVDRDGVLGLTDPVRLLNFLFSGFGEGLPCDDAADANDDGQLNVADGIYTLGFLFSGGSPPPAPFPSPGDDATDDGLACVR